MPDLSNIVTASTSGTKPEAEAEPNHGLNRIDNPSHDKDYGTNRLDTPSYDKDHGTNRLATPDMDGDTITHNISPNVLNTFWDKPGTGAEIHCPADRIPLDVQLATPKSNKSAGDTEPSPTRWYPSSKAEFFEARRENKLAMMQSSSVAKKYSRLAISDIMGEDQEVTVGRKRKADDISSALDEEIIWQAGEVQKSEARGAEQSEEVRETMDVDNDKEASEPLETSIEASIDDEEVIEPMEVSTEASTEAVATTVGSLDLPVSVTAGTLRLDDSERPAKRQRLRNIAEKVSYIALGGITTGAVMFSALVYTAPTFV